VSVVNDGAAGAAPLPIVPRTLGPTKHRARVSDLWSTRRVAWMLGVRDMKAKYKQAALGPLWLVIAPLGMLAAVMIAFAGITSVDTGGIPYVLFALTGLTVWTFIQLSLTLGSTAIQTNSVLVRRSPIPRLALVTGPMIGNMPPFLIMLALSVGGAAVSGRMPIQALLLPLLLIWLFVFVLAAMLLVVSVSVRYRDTVSLMPLILQAGIFVSPVGYSLSGAPRDIHLLLLFNPVSGLIEAWRWGLLGLNHPDLTAIAIAGAWTVALVIIGWGLFRRMEVDFADYV
jgi:lipopolysaccharide transport system permease protein